MPANASICKYWQSAAKQGEAYTPNAATRSHGWSASEAGQRSVAAEASRHEQPGQTENNHRRDAKPWIVPPVAVSFDLLDGGASLELLIGYTRLGNLLALSDCARIEIVIIFATRT